MGAWPPVISTTTRRGSGRGSRPPTPPPRGRVQLRRGNWPSRRGISCRSGDRHPRRAPRPASPRTIRPARTRGPGQVHQRLVDGAKSSTSSSGPPARARSTPADPVLSGRRSGGRRRPRLGGAERTRSRWPVRVPDLYPLHRDVRERDVIGRRREPMTVPGRWCSYAVSPGARTAARRLGSQRCWTASIRAWAAAETAVAVVAA